jgi:drug/metabolite transporter (DMT)-like permease
VTGDILNLTNAFSFSFFLVISKPILSRHSSLAVTAQMLVFGAAGIAALGGRQLVALDFGSVSAGVWTAAFLIILFPTVGAYILNAWALKRVESSTVALFIYLQPLIASILAASLLGEPIGAESLVSAVLIFAGLAVAVLWRSPGGGGGFASAAFSTDIGPATRAPRRGARDPDLHGRFDEPPDGV